MAENPQVKLPIVRFSFDLSLTRERATILRRRAPHYVLARIAAPGAQAI
jgi:hypothetical protein